MNTLEKMLQALGSTNPFKKDGTLSKSGSEAYRKLIEIVYGFGEIGVCDEMTASDIIEELDRVADENN